MNDTMILREITERDVAVIQSWPAYPEEFKDLDYALREAGWISEYLGKDGATICVAEERGALIGFTILSRDDADGKSSRAEFRIALHPDILGQGAGEKLARMTIRKGLEEAELERIYLIVRRSNPRARKLYQHCGFRDIVEYRKEVNGIVVDLQEMELEKENFKGWMRHDND
jgi:diamine N-acetyltransferase